MNNLTKNSLVFTAGFCDTATFIHMDGVFSAHVTGNFVLFAAAIAKGLAPADYLKIAAFPVFILACMAAAAAYKGAPRRLLIIMTGLILACGAAALALSIARGAINLGIADSIITLCLVFALGVQNTVHHFIPGPMTTVMTGTVMNTTASLTEKYLLRRPPTPPQKGDSPSGTILWMVFYFAVGCLISAWLTVSFGLAAVLVPGLVLALLLAIRQA